MELNMLSFIKNNELLEKFNEIWQKVKHSIKKEFDSESVYNEKIQKLKQNLIMEKGTQILTIIKYQKKVPNVFVYQ